MSILIEGIEMPKGCIGCRFCEHGSINEWDLYCGIDNKHVGNWDDKHINNGWRRPDCPLVPVPITHEKSEGRCRWYDTCPMAEAEEEHEHTD